MVNQIGALPHQDLLQFMAAGFIQNSNSKNASPASVDLSLSDEVYRVESVTLPLMGETVRSLLPLMDAQEHDPMRPFRKGGRYLVRLEECLALPPEYYGFCNPKSSTGRLDVHVRVLADGVPRYDSVPAGYQGELWLYVVSKSFSIQASPEDTLSQLRLFNGDTRLGRHEMTMAFAEHRLAWDLKGQKQLPYSRLQSLDKDGGLMLSLYLPKEGEVFGYRCIADSGQVLKLADRNVPPAEFFKPVRVRGGAAQLTHNRFYILSSAEAIIIPPNFAAEMVAMDDRSGEFRSHYAGFLDPGWGYGADGKGRGRPFTLEVRPFEDLVVRGQPIAKIQYERMIASPKVQYDSASKLSHYMHQFRPQLAKQFAPWPE